MHRTYARCTFGGIRTSRLPMANEALSPALGAPARATRRCTRREPREAGRGLERRLQQDGRGAQAGDRREAVAQEDYDAAAALKRELKASQQLSQKHAELKQAVQAAVAEEDYETAAKLQASFRLSSSS